MAKKILAIAIAAVTTVALGVTALAVDRISCRTYLYERRQYAREFITHTAYTEYVDIVTAGIQCLRIDTGAEVGTGELVSNKNSCTATASQSVLYVDCSQQVRAFGSHSAYKNGKAVLFEFTQSKDAA